MHTYRPSTPQTHSSRPPLIPFPPCVACRFVERRRRFSVAVDMDGTTTWIHSNNSGAMLGLLQLGAPVLASRSDNPRRKLAHTQEAVWIAPGRNRACAADTESEGGFWVGVDTSVPNRMIEAAFLAGLLPFAQGYTEIRREVRRGQSRLDALLTGPGLPPLWVECKNVTMVEDDVACFPDAASERGRKHLHELMDIVAAGERAAMFYLVQRPDGRCFGPAAVVDPLYAALFWQAVDAGVSMQPWRGVVTPQGVDLGDPLPLACRGTDHRMSTHH